MADPNVTAQFKRALRVKKAGPKVSKALFEAGITESGMRNLNYGDRDSKGPLQQRASTGWKHATDPYLAALDFLAQAQKLNQSGFKGSAGQLAQAVQRSAFPARYDQHSKEAEKLLGAYTATKATPVGTTYGTPSVAAPPTTQDKGKLLFSYLQGGQGNIANVFAQLGQASAPAAASSPAPASAMKAPAVGAVKAVFERAAAVNAQHLPYQWGGGHGPTPAKPGVPLDCSGAVSKVLNVSPRVSGQFTTFGAPGKGKNVTIYANGHHVLMEINGHFWGTSATNPGGGAGWIKRSAISPGYLKGFTARHPPGM